MWAVRAGLRFLVQLVAAVVIALAVGGLWAVAHGGGFRHSLSVAFIVIGVLMLLLGMTTAGPQSSANRLLETSGRIPGMRAQSLQPKPGEISVRPGPLLIGAGLVVIAIGIVLFPVQRYSEDHDRGVQTGTHVYGRSTARPRPSLSTRSIT